MSEFPSNAYSSAQEKWLGRDHLITPTIRKAFGDILNQKAVVDVGCGNGHYSFDFLNWGAAKVLGIDNSEDMIQKCRSLLTNEHKNRFSQIGFEKIDISSEIPTFNSNFGEKFDIATAFFVLQFVHDKKKLENAILNISKILTSSGVMFGLIPNGVDDVRPPEDMGEKLGARIRKEGGKPFVDGEIVDIDFFENNEVCGSAKIALHSREFYEKCFKSAGFSKIEWISPHFTDYAKELLGEQFCHQFLNPPCDILFKCSK